MYAAVADEFLTLKFTGGMLGSLDIVPHVSGIGSYVSDLCLAIQFCSVRFSNASPWMEALNRLPMRPLSGEVRLICTSVCAVSLMLVGWETMMGSIAQMVSPGFNVKGVSLTQTDWLIGKAEKAMVTLTMHGSKVTASFP